MDRLRNPFPIQLGHCIYQHLRIKIQPIDNTRPFACAGPVHNPDPPPPRSPTKPAHKTAKWPPPASPDRPRATTRAPDSRTAASPLNPQTSGLANQHAASPVGPALAKMGAVTSFDRSAWTVRRQVSSRRTRRIKAAKNREGTHPAVPTHSRVVQRHERRQPRFAALRGLIVLRALREETCGIANRYAATPNKRRAVK